MASAGPFTIFSYARGRSGDADNTTRLVRAVQPDSISESDLIRLGRGGRAAITSRYSACAAEMVKRLVGTGKPARRAETRCRGEGLPTALSPTVFLADGPEPGKGRAGGRTGRVSWCFVSCLPVVFPSGLSIVPPHVQFLRPVSSDVSVDPPTCRAEKAAVPPNQPLKHTVLFVSPAVAVPWANGALCEVFHQAPAPELCPWFDLCWLVQKEREKNRMGLVREQMRGHGYPIGATHAFPHNIASCSDEQPFQQVNAGPSAGNPSRNAGSKRSAAFAGPLVTLAARLKPSSWCGLPGRSAAVRRTRTPTHRLLTKLSRPSSGTVFGLAYREVHYSQLRSRGLTTGVHICISKAQPDLPLSAHPAARLTSALTVKSKRLLPP
jgi:hypothetical protein